jgi:hypothetical protein
MSEKHLTELPWKTLIAKHKVKETKLAKALGDYGKCDEANPDAQIKALAVVDKEAEALKKEHKALKEVDAYLVEMLKEVDKARKAAEMRKKAPKEKPPGKEKEEKEAEGEEEKKPTKGKEAEKKPVKGKEDAEEGKKKKDEGEEEEEEEIVDIKSALTGAMGKVKTRKPEDPPMRAILCQSGQQFGVLLGKSVGSAQQNKLKEVLKGSTHKFVKGTCEWSKGDIYTFVLDSPLSGAAQGLKKFFQEHTGMSYKLRVGPAGAMEEDLAEAQKGEGTEAEDDEVPKAPPKPGAKPGTSPSGEPPPKPVTPPPTANPMLSSFVKAKKEWKGGKAAAEKGIATLKAAILSQCDPELQAPVNGKINVWDGILGIVDDSVIIPTIDEAIKETDAGRQVEYKKQLAGIVAGLVSTLQQHSLASVADSNPFGKFHVRAPLNVMLSRLAESFSTAA